MAAETLWNCYRDEINNFAIENNDHGNKINNNKAIASISFAYKTKIMGRTPNDNNKLDTEVVVSLKYLSSFWRFISFPLINCEIKLDLSSSKEYTISVCISISNS